MLESFQSTKAKNIITTSQNQKNNEYTKQFENNFMDSDDGFQEPNQISVMTGSKDDEPILDETYQEDNFKRNLIMSQDSSMVLDQNKSMMSNSINLEDSHGIII